MLALPIQYLYDESGGLSCCCQVPHERWRLLLLELPKPVSSNATMVPVLVEFHGVHVRYDVVVCDALTLEIEEGRGAANWAVEEEAACIEGSAFR